MNLNYLMRHISRQLHTIVRQYREDGQLLTTVCERHGFADYISAHPDYAAHFLLPGPENLPRLTTIRHQLLYACVPADGMYFLVGPVLLSVPAPCRHDLPDDAWPDELTDLIWQCDLDPFVQQILLLYNLFQDEPVISSDVTAANYLTKHVEHEIQQNYSDIVFLNQEIGNRHNPYDQEIREFTSIRTGDVEQLKKSWAEDYIGTLGTLAKDPLRNYKNLGIVLIVLASRAAMEGGLLPEIAYSLSDSYICQIEETSTLAAAMALGRKAELQYTLLVKEMHDQKMQNTKTQTSASDAPNVWVEKCKTYIFSHLHDKITISDIARELYLNPNYLSDLFRRHEGITIGAFILQEKIKLVKNMLIYSRYSYSEIATYFGFSSQSHLGRQFRKVTGLTPKQYRDQYGMKDF